MTWWWKPTLKKINRSLDVHQFSRFVKFTCTVTIMALLTKVHLLLLWKVMGDSACDFFLLKVVICLCHKHGTKEKSESPICYSLFSVVKMSGLTSGYSQNCHQWQLPHNSHFFLLGRVIQSFYLIYLQQQPLHKDHGQQTIPIFEPETLQVSYNTSTFPCWSLLFDHCGEVGLHLLLFSGKTGWGFWC